MQSPFILTRSPFAIDNDPGASPRDQILQLLRNEQEEATELLDSCPLLTSLFIKLNRSATAPTAPRESDEMIALRNMYSQQANELVQLRGKYEEVEKEKETAEAGYEQFEKLYVEAKKAEEKLYLEHKALQALLEDTKNALTIARENIETMTVEHEREITDLRGEMKVSKEKASKTVEILEVWHSASYSPLTGRTEQREKLTASSGGPNNNINDLDKQVTPSPTSSEATKPGAPALGALSSKEQITNERGTTSEKPAEDQTCFPDSALGDKGDGSTRRNPARRSWVSEMKKEESNRTKPNDNVYQQAIGNAEGGIEKPKEDWDNVDVTEATNNAEGTSKDSGARNNLGSVKNGLARFGGNRNKPANR